MRNAITIFMLLSGCGFLFASPAAGQGWCNGCLDDPETTSHTAPQSPLIIIGYYGPTHFSSYFGSCLFHHEAGCTHVEEEILEQLASDDIRDQMNAIKRLEHRVLVNVARKSLQVMGCDGTTVIANVPMASDRLRRAEELLAGLMTSADAPHPEM